MKWKSILLAIIITSTINGSVSASEFEGCNCIEEEWANQLQSLSEASEVNSKTISDGEQEMLLKIGESEAGDQGPIGIALVMRVVINRSEQWGMSIEDVIFQPYQFSVINNGSYYRKTPGPDCYEALEMIKSGWDESEGSLFFCEGWFPWASYVKSYSSHNFFK